MNKELAVIAHVAAMAGNSEAFLDDAFWDAEHRLIFTTDMLVEGHHFSLDYFSPYDLGWKAAAVNISDVAAMGGQLKYLLISLALPPEKDMTFVEGLYKGLGDACNRYGGKIIGGDTVSSSIVTLNITAIGTCPEGTTVGRRFNAKPGDWIITTGFHGLSHVGLTALQQQWPDFKRAKEAHLRPIPNMDAGLVLAQKFERYALTDSSDGLADALIKMAESSHQRLVVEERKLAIHPELAAYAHKLLQNDAAQSPSQAQAIAMEALLYGGEDFQLVAAVPSVDAEVLAHFHVIGRVLEPDALPELSQHGAWMQKQNQEYIPLTLQKTYQHFEDAV